MSFYSKAGFVILAHFLWTIMPTWAQSPVQNVANVSSAEVTAVYFHADWCHNCRVLQPALARAKVKSGNLSVQHVTLDFTNPATWDQAIETSLDHGIVPTYNAYAGTTGFVILLANDTGEKIDCITRLSTANAMVSSLQSAVERAQNTAPGTRDAGSIMCPTARAAP